MTLKNTNTALAMPRALPEGVTAYRNGLVIPPGTSHDEWLKIGTVLAGLVGSSMWLIGDWLAYGQESYRGLPGYERQQNEIYTKVAAETGFAEGTLKNAKCVCAAVNLSRRRDKLTYCQAQEIVGRTTPGQFDFWIAKATTPGPDGRFLTVKKLREELRMSKATHKPEPHDTGTTSPLLVTDQYVRDMLALNPAEFTPDQKKAHLRNLRPVLEALAP